jgi:hypothetical protein
VYRQNQAAGQVANLQAGVMTVGGDFVVRNKQGQAVPVVHQYDRDEKLMNELFRQFVDWDMHVEKVGEGACAGYTIKENIEAFKGRCDLSQDGTEGGWEGCCQMCTEKPSCKGFTYLRKSCWLKTCNNVDEATVLAVPGATGGWLT